MKKAREYGFMPIEQVVRQLTQVPAETMGITDHVIVNGRLAVENGVVTDARPGTVSYARVSRMICSSNSNCWACSARPSSDRIIRVCWPSSGGGRSSDRRRSGPKFHAPPMVSNAP